VRDLFASTREARRLGLRPRDFSFNVEGGRCEVCEGTGTQTIDMQFLADVTVTCEQCEGARFQDRILEIHYEGLNVNQVLDLTVSGAIRVFAGQTKIVRGLLPLIDVGLGYLRLGQSTATLSGGEAQRLKLASHLAQARKSDASGTNVLLLFDEPTTGLHPADLDVLLSVFDRLLDEGFSILVIEHNLELIAHADWIVDLGPEGGDEGGDVVATGPPESVATHEGSYTARYLRTRLGGA
jgi:excinuclease ABC subunit A